MRKGLLVLALIIVGTLFGAPDSKVAAIPLRDCSSMAIMQCGAPNPRTFIDKVKAQKKYKDLQTIYAYQKYGLGLQKNMYEDFARNAVGGTIFATDGRIEVNGQVVGYSRENLARKRNAEFTKRVVIGNKTYYAGAFTKTNHADEQPIMVWFDKYGIARIAILNSTGAPQGVEAIATKLHCSAITKKRVAGKPNTYAFTAKASAANGVKIVGVEYNFGDGIVSRTSYIAKPYRHTFTKSSTVVAKPLYEMPGSGTVIAYSAKGDNCTTRITVNAPKPPAKPAKPAPVAPAAPQPQAPTPPVTQPATTEPPKAVCSALNAQLTNEATRGYRFTATAQAGSNTTFKQADFNFGDGVVIKAVQPYDGKAVLDHSYEKAGTYTITATLHFTDNQNGNQVLADCQTTVVTPAGTPPPSAATDDDSESEAEAAPEDVPAEDEATDENDELINVGPGQTVVGLFGGVSALAAFGHWWFRRRLGL